MSALDEKKADLKRLLESYLDDVLGEYKRQISTPVKHQEIATAYELWLRGLCYDEPGLLPSCHFVEVIPDELDRSRVEVQVSVPYSDELADRLWEAGVEFTVGGKPYTREYTFVVGEALVSPFPICENKKEK